ncbi:PRC-barrel domain protein [Halopolyspora algeriensis]|uniref:PRC-barrel domain protein n=1 Tax=Halopolyspora algeriensis TaxID=1500506 RepID=A0A368VRM2_9ACTN|nr:PRC-barrel domain-containing protein [Halopolyspora algeriensis]RCW43655.1 PRC-barrel domain protein [Halopolyspora algeriensis]TQM47562.1 PRC-barrel domain protein [Halopolyspora algeriensis]
MDDATRAQELIGNDVYDRDGARIGRVGTVYLDDTTHQPEWITVRTGLFGMKEHFVPLAGASSQEQRVQLDVSRKQVEDAPRVDAEHGHLSEQEGRDLYRYYGFRSLSASTPHPVADRPRHLDSGEGGEQRRTERAAPVPTGRHHRSEIDSEERLVVPAAGRSREGRHRKDPGD